jgi:hypothetical protein
LTISPCYTSCHWVSRTWRWLNVSQIRSFSERSAFFRIWSSYKSFTIVIVTMLRRGTRTTGTPEVTETSGISWKNAIIKKYIFYLKDLHFLTWKTGSTDFLARNCKLCKLRFISCYLVWFLEAHSNLNNRMFQPLI